MATAAAPPPTFAFETFADVLDRVGNVPPARVRLHPAPGTATEADVLAVHDREGRLCELVDGILVEKTMGFVESRFAVVLGYVLMDYLRRHDLGTAVGADGMMRLFPGRVHITDFAFISWERFPKSRRETEGIARLVPDLVVEVLSKSNTKKEMSRKLQEYFRAGVRLVWYADPKARTVRAYTSPTESVLLREGDTLDGGDVLPGFTLSIRDWFDEAERLGPRRP
jgi:Uma2 family endonuclease